MTRGLQISDAEWDVMEPVWAVGACTAADVISILEKKRQDVTSYRIEIEGTRLALAYGTLLPLELADGSVALVTDAAIKIVKLTPGFVIPYTP